MVFLPFIGSMDKFEEEGQFFLAWKLVDEYEPNQNQGDT